MNYIKSLGFQIVDEQSAKQASAVESVVKSRDNRKVVSAKKQNNQKILCPIKGIVLSGGTYITEDIINVLKR